MKQVHIRPWTGSSRTMKERMPPIVSSLPPLLIDRFETRVSSLADYISRSHQCKPEAEHLVDTGTELVGCEGYDMQKGFGSIQTVELPRYSQHHI